MQEWTQHSTPTTHTHHLKLPEHRPAHTLNTAEAKVTTLVGFYYLCSHDALIFYGEILGGACIWSGLYPVRISLIMYTGWLHHPTLVTEQLSPTVAMHTGLTVFGGSSQIQSGTSQPRMSMCTASTPSSTLSPLPDVSTEVYDERALTGVEDMKVQSKET